jgi:hypothetical protein
LNHAQNAGRIGANHDAIIGLSTQLMNVSATLQKCKCTANISTYRPEFMIGIERANQAAATTTIVG